MRSLAETSDQRLVAAHYLYPKGPHSSRRRGAISLRTSAESSHPPHRHELVSARGLSGFSIGASRNPRP